MDNFGMRAKILHARFGIVECRNVTEVHHLYPHVFMNRAERVAFESNIHGAGVVYDVYDVYDVSDIIEMEITPETELADEF